MKARLTLKVHAGARRTEFGERYGDAWKLYVAAPPVDGKANLAIVRFLAETTGVSTGCVRIVRGATSSLKIVEIDGVAQNRLERAILESHGYRPDSGIAAPRKP